MNGQVATQVMGDVLVTTMTKGQVLILGAGTAERAGLKSMAPVITRIPAGACGSATLVSKGLEVARAMQIWVACRATCCHGNNQA